MPNVLLTGNGLILREGNSSMRVTCEGESITLEFSFSTVLPDEHTIGIQYPFEDVVEFSLVTQLFDVNGLCRLSSNDKGADILIGYDIFRNIEIFFEVVDYGSPEPKSEFKRYCFEIDESAGAYGELRGLVEFMIKEEQKRKGAGKDEYKLDRTQYERASRF